MGNETRIGQFPEAVSPYAEIDNDTLIDAFYETEGQGDPEIGRELMGRIFEHGRFGVDPVTEPLIGRDGRQVEVAGHVLTLAGYLGYAAAHHPEAIEDILDFLTMKPDEKDYDDTRASMQGRLMAGRG